jgi:hypothetical protein
MKYKITPIDIKGSQHRYTSWTRCKAAIGIYLHGSITKLSDYDQFDFVDGVPNEPGIYDIEVIDDDRPGILWLWRLDRGVVTFIEDKEAMQYAADLYLRKPEFF